MNPTFALQIGYHGREDLAICLSSHLLQANVIRRDFPLPGEIPIGSVEFCRDAFGEHRLDFYPEFLNNWLHRQVSRVSSGHLLVPRFVKDATAWKSDWVSRVMPAGSALAEGDWWVSEPVTFMQEWRYYVANGEVVTTGWYAGEDDNESAPALDIEWPDGFSGAVDFGRLDTDEIALVEAHAPFACGWYGEGHADYARWCAEAWNNADWWKILTPAKKLRKSKA